MDFQTNELAKSERDGTDHQSSGDSSEGEDQEEPSSIHEVQDDVEEDLSSFREKWQKELNISPQRSQPESPEPHQETDSESEAKLLFMKGVELERSGKLFEAIQFYRRAVQMVPDIEFRLDPITKSQPSRDLQLSEQEVDGSSYKSDDYDDQENDDDEEIKEGDLFAIIEKKMERFSTVCIPENEQRMTHISALPFEMILSILKWVVTSDLDLRSLEMFSMVCRGFYLCARDPEIWRLVCVRVWGLINCGNAPVNYPSWRHMFIETSHLHFNGCYIGKTTYVRYGENSFQDQFYRPWHSVNYYRYLRFFPEGAVLVLTSSEEPSQCVGLLKYRNVRNPILKGYYRLIDDKVIVIVQRKENNNFKKVPNKRRGVENNLHEIAEQTFHMELQIKSTNKKRHVQLDWTHYSIFTRTVKGDESTCNFDLVGSRFPPFSFSRVKSYTSESDNPLQ